MRSILILAIVAFAAVAHAGGYSNGQVVNGYVYRDGWYYGKSLAYKPYSYYGKVRYEIKSYAPVDVKSRLLDLARALGLSSSDVQSVQYSAGSYSPLYNALASGQSIQYGNSNAVQSATSYLVQSNLGFDFNADTERKDQFRLELAKILGTDAAGAQALTNQFAQIVGIGAQVAASQAQAATTIAEKEEGTKQLELLLQAVLAVQPKDKSAVNVTGGGGAVGVVQPQQPPNQVFSLATARGLETCLACHGEGGKAKAMAAARLDGVITDTLFAASVSAMASGEMPPAEWTSANGAWTDAETVRTISQLRVKTQ